MPFEERERARTVQTIYVEVNALCCHEMLNASSTNRNLLEAYSTWIRRVHTKHMPYVQAYIYVLQGNCVGIYGF